MKLEKVTAIKLASYLLQLIKDKEISPNEEISLSIDAEGNGFSPLFFQGIRAEVSEDDKNILTFYPLKVRI